MKTRSKWCGRHPSGWSLLASRKTCYCRIRRWPPPSRNWTRKPRVTCSLPCAPPPAGCFRLRSSRFACLRRGRNRTGFRASAEPSVKQSALHPWCRQGAGCVPADPARRWPCESPDPRCRKCPASRLASSTRLRLRSAPIRTTPTATCVLAPEAHPERRAGRSEAVAAHQAGSARAMGTGLVMHWILTLKFLNADSV